MAKETSTEDYLELELTNFNGATDPAQEMHSYLRLGAADSTNTVTHGNDLSSQVTSYIDDSRIRGPADVAGESTATTDNPFRTLSQTQRAAETAKLTTKGGWLDHTDGNRVTTTRGDKVEVIRGNYKLLVLGREQWTEDNGVGLNWESSGGVTYHFDEVPGQIVDVRWEFDAANTQTWRVIEECDKGHVVTRYHGLDKDWIQGGDFVTRVGSLKAYDGTTNSTDPDEFTYDDHFDKPSDASHNASFNWPSSDKLANVTEHVFADEFYDMCVAQKVEDYLGSSTRWVDEFEDQQHAIQLLEDHDFSTEYRAEMKGDFAFELWLGAIYFELFQGTAISYKEVIFFDLRVAELIAEVNAGAAFGEVNAAAIIWDLETCMWKLDVVISPFRINEIEGAVIKIDVPALLKKKTAISHYDESVGINAK